jgi:hypothetical protein
MPVQPAISFETPNYIVRTLTVDDASERWAQWMMDAEAARMLNVKPVAMTMDQLRTYIERFDGDTRLLFGVFDKVSGQLLSIRAFYVDPVKKAFLDNALVGEPDARGKAVQRESTAALQRYFFLTRDLVSCHAAINAHNRFADFLLGRGWVKERSEMRPSVSGEGSVETLYIVLTREAWRKREHALGNMV